MDKKDFIWRTDKQTLSGCIDPVKQALQLTVTYPDGSEICMTAQDGCSNPTKLGRTNTYGRPGQWSFFTAETVLEEQLTETQKVALLTTPLSTGVADEKLTCHYQLTWLPQQQAVRILTWFEGDVPFTAHQLKWLDLDVNQSDLLSFSAGLPAWQHTIAAMTEPLAFRDYVALHNEQAAFTLCCAGRIVLAPQESSLRLAAFTDLLAYQDDLLHFTSSQPLSAWISLAPWQDSATFLQQRDRLVRQPAAPITHAVDRSPKPLEGEMICLTAGDLAVHLIRQDSGVLLNGIGGVLPVYEGAPPQSLFSAQVLDLRDGQTVVLTSDSGWQSVAVDRSSDRTVLHFNNPLIDRHPVEDFTLQVTAIGRPEQNRIEWRVDVLNNHPGLSVLSCDFPVLPFAGGQWDMVIPKASGVLHRDAARHGHHLSSIYPAYTLAMPWYALYRPDQTGLNGVYCGAHDPDACRKDLTSTTLPGSETGRIRFSCPAENLGRGANSWALPGCMVWQLFSGDWYDAACIYRDFVHDRADWLPDSSLQGRPDSPDWFRTLPFWIMDWLPNGNPDKEPIPVSIRPETPPGPRDWIELPLKLQKALGVPIGYHVYNWHWIPFNNDFPHYFPVEDGFADGVQELQDGNVQVMPYINGRLWDTLDQRDEDVRFTREALPHAAKHLDGSVMTESYASHEPDGRLCRLAVMCPSSWFWVREMKRVTDRLFREVGVKAIYIDQVAAASQNLCCDPGHNHQPGGGNWWNHSYQAMMRELGRNKPSDRAFTTECNAEPYAGSFDGYLTWQWIEPEQVPAFPLIYAGRVAMLGRNINGYKKKDIPYCKFHIADQVLFGQQIGWINADVVDDPHKFPFLKKMVQLRWQYRDLFNRGRLLRPPLVASDVKETPSFAGMGRPPAWQVFAMPAVRAGLWQDESGETCTLFVVNTAGQAADCTLQVKLDGRQMPALDDCRLIHCETEGENGQPALEQRPDGLQVQIKLAAEGMLVLEWPLD